MQYIFWIFCSLVAYVAGVFVLLRVTPMLLHRHYDEGLFMGIAALDIFGALLAFGGIIVLLLLYSGALGVRILGFILLIGVLLVAARLTRRSFQARAGVDTFSTSRIIAGCYSVFLALAALYYIVQIFILGR